MKTSKILCMAAGLMLLFACNSDELDEFAGRIPINLGYETLTVEEATRTAVATDLNDANIASGRGVMVRISTDNGSSYSPYTYTTNGGSSAMTPPSPKPYYPTSGNVKIVAYHPATAGTTFIVESDQTNETNYHNSDLMFSNNITAQPKTTSTVNLQFTHKMAKLVVTATKGDGVNGIKTITLKQVARQVTFDQTTGTVGTATATGSTDVTLFTDGSNTTASGTGAALIPAQTITGALLEIVTDQGTATYSVASPGKTFNANTKYTVNVTVNRTAVGITNSFNWGNEASLEVNPTTPVVQYVFLPVGASPGIYTIDDSGTKVFFSKGNLQATYDGSSWTWSFAANQWDFIASAADNKVTDTSPYVDMTGLTTLTIDLFGWVGASSTWTAEAPLHGITSSKATNATDGYGNVWGESLKSDWGDLPITNGGGAAGSGWRTLTSAEWQYLFNTRSASTVNGKANARYAKARVNSNYGVILFPDSYTHPAGVTAPKGINVTSTAGWTGNSYSGDNWAKMESAGCVFLPAAGYRNEASVYYAWKGNSSAEGYYWSSEAVVKEGSYSTAPSNAYDVYIHSGGLGRGDSSCPRYYGCSVRLVRNVE